MANEYFVVIAGAGASRDLGHQPLPLMGDWAASIVEDLGKGPTSPDSIGLRDEMDGFEFEKALGRFLEAQQLIARGAAVLSTFGALGSPDFATYTEPWFTSAGSAAGDIVEVINANLVRNFGRGVVAPDKAASTYGRLVEFLGSHGVDTNQIAFATTNYDRAIEIGLRKEGYTVVDGFEEDVGVQLPRLSASGIVERTFNRPEYPVLHLHGAVNWYVNEEGVIVRQFEDTPYSRVHGTPALLLPDPEKEPSTDSRVSELWSEFERAIARCSHVLIIGHGLNDQAMIRLLNERGRPVGWATPRATKNRDWLEERIPGATPIDLQFGPSFGRATPFVNWLGAVVPG